VDTSGETENIFRGEIEDGIANCAEESAHAWAIEASEQGRTDPFVRDLLKLTRMCSSKRDDDVKAAAVNDNQSEKKLHGNMGSASRAQPRYQSGKAATYDRK
jgi:hypothetical protein